MKEKSNNDVNMEFIYEEGLEDFHTDEEPEKNEDQKEDMRAYLTKMNKRIENLVDALQMAEKMVTKATDEKLIRAQVAERANGGELSSFFLDRLNQEN